jgi:hypothetical protein
VKGPAEAKDGEDADEDGEEASEQAESDEAE